MGRDRDELQLKESEGMYPPHFRVVIDGKHTFEKATGHLTFSGTTSDLVFDILLVPPTLTMGELIRHTMWEMWGSLTIMLSKCLTELLLATCL